MKADTQTTSSSEPNAGAVAAPVVEAPVTETPVTETPVTETPVARSDTPAPMETGGAGDGHSWAERAEADVDEEFQQDRPAKHRRSQSRRHEQRPQFPSPSKTVRGGSPLFHSSTSMPESSLPPATMWQVEGSCISIQRCCQERPCAWETRSPA